MDDGPSLEIFAKMKLGLENIHKTLRQAAAIQRSAYYAEIPKDVRLIASGIVGTAPNPTTTALVNLGSPDQGHVWLLRNLILTNGNGPNINSVLGGTAFLIVTVAPPSPIGLTASSVGLKDSPFAAVPVAKQYSNRQVVVKAEEFLYVLLTGGTNGQTLFAQADVEDVEESAAKHKFEI